MVRPICCKFSVEKKSESHGHCTSQTLPLKRSIYWHTKESKILRMQGQRLGLKISTVRETVRPEEYSKKKQRVVIIE